MIRQSAYPNTLKHEIKHQIGDFQIEKMVNVSKNIDDDEPRTDFCGFYG